MKVCFSKKVDVNTIIKDDPSSFLHQFALFALFEERCRIADYKKCEIARLLIDSGAKPDLRGNFGCALTTEACSAEMMKILLSSRAKPDLDACAALHAHAKRNFKQCQLLIEAKANINATDELGYSPLIWAVKYGNYNVVQLLLNLHADTTITTNSGKTARNIPAYTYAEDRSKQCAQCKQLVRDYDRTNRTHSSEFKTASKSAYQKPVTSASQDVSVIHVLFTSSV